MCITPTLEKQSSLESRIKTWLYYIAGNFDLHRVNPPIRAIIKDKNGKQYEELLNDVDWVAIGYVPRPTTRLGWFVHHIVHGLAMHYPLRCVLAFAFLNSPPGAGGRSSEIQTTTMKYNRIDLWLNQADLMALNQFANRYGTSCQRVIETALAQAAARGMANTDVLNGYERTQRVPIRLDQLGREQLETLSADIGASHQDALRLALQSLFESATDRALGL